jgi:hypothetical protein
MNQQEFARYQQAQFAQFQQQQLQFGQPSLQQAWMQPPQQQQSSAQAAYQQPQQQAPVAYTSVQYPNQQGVATQGMQVHMKYSRVAPKILAAAKIFLKRRFR